jgi:cobalt-zinc-cadmium efflux system outer membrane protein
VLPSYRASAGPTLGDEAASPEEPIGEVTLARALELALLRNPELQAASFEIRAREAAQLQAGLFPNPSLDTESEDLALSDQAIPEVSQPQTTVRLSQLIELGGKRAARVRAAAAGAALAGWAYEARRLDVLARTTEAFVALLGAQERARLSNDSVALARQVAEAVSERVKAGVVSPIEETKAQVAVASAEVDEEAARRALAAARRRLALAWNSHDPTFREAAGTLPPVVSIPREDLLAARLQQNPDLARWDAELARRRAAVDVESARRIPDVTLTAGYRKFHDTGNDALVVGGSVPLPILNQNQGAIAEAHARLAGAVRERQAAESRTRAALAEAYRALSSAHGEAALLDSSVLPGAQRAYDATREGYQLGKFGFLDVLDAQRTLFAARVRHLDALVAFHTAVAEVERLTGEPLGADGGAR